MPNPSAPLRPLLLCARPVFFEVRGEEPPVHPKQFQAHLALAKLQLRACIQLRAGNDERRNHSFVNGLPETEADQSSRREAEGAEKKYLSFSSGIGLQVGATNGGPSPTHVSGMFEVF